MSANFFHTHKKYNTESATRSQLVNTYRSLNHWNGFQFKLFWEGIVVGIFSGLVVSLFRLLLSRAEEFRIGLYGHLSQLSAVYTAGWFAALLVVGGVLYRLTRHEPMAGGSGIPQVKGVILGLMRMNWFRILWVKLTAGVIGLGAGLSLGREGPSIQLGAVTAQ
ncbi:MAG: chloride channel protein, partial [Succiniclasticum sp.]|nr:chloride channel protein [Succiniclasticum sp.]